MKQFVFGLAAIAAFSAASYATDVNIKPGLWEFTYTMKMEGMPAGIGGNVPPRTEKECITKEETKDFKPDMGDTGEDCKTTVNKITSSGHIWEISCTNDGVTSTGKGEVKFNGDTTTGSVTMNTPASGPMGPVTMKQTFTGKRIGECK